jgi:SAM-dependent methyltransferase
MNGWQVTGVDWIASALDLARQRAVQARVPEGRNTFVRADVESADFLADHLPVSLWLDIGCLHGIRAEGQARYAEQARRLVAPGGVLRLYCWQRHEKDGRMVGLNPDEVEALFAPAFVLEDVVLSHEGAEQRPTAWYWFLRIPDWTCDEG